MKTSTRTKNRNYFKTLRGLREHMEKRGWRPNFGGLSFYHPVLRGQYEAVPFQVGDRTFYVLRRQL